MFDYDTATLVYHDKQAMESDICCRYINNNGYICCKYSVT